MNVTALALPDVLLIEPRIFCDERGYFFESFNSRQFAQHFGFEPQFVQDNQSYSQRHVLRGLHYQVQQAQGKLIRVLQGEILDVAVDIRRSSPTFGQYVMHTLTASSKQQIWIPKGYAHGFLVLSESAEVLYKTTDYYAPAHERCLLWNDPAIAIAWPAGIHPTLSVKDTQGVLLRDAEVFV